MLLQQNLVALHMEKARILDQDRAARKSARMDTERTCKDRENEAINMWNGNTQLYDESVLAYYL